MLSPAMFSLFIMGIRASTLAIKFALTLFIARFLGLEELGFYGLVTALTIMAPPFLGFGFMTIIARRAVVHSREQLTQSLRYYTGFLFLVYLVIMIGVLAYALTHDSMLLVLLTFVVIVLEHFNQDIYNLLLNLSHPFAANLMHFIRAALWAVMFMVGAWFAPELRNTIWLLTFWALGSVFGLLVFWWLARHWPWTREKAPEPLKAWFCMEFKESRILYANGLVQTAGTYLDRFVVSLFLGMELTGVYVLFLSVFGALSNLVQTGVIQFARPRMIRAYKEKNPEYAEIFYKCMRGTVLACFLLAVPAAAVMYMLLPYIGKPLAMEQFHVLWFVLIAFIISGVMQVQGLVFYSQHRDKHTLLFNIISFALVLIINFLLIPIFGIIGAATASIISTLAVMGLQHQKIKKFDLLNNFV